MKSSIHPQDYRLVVFSDEVAGFAFLTRSTAQTKETIKWEDGQTYPLVKMHISSASHPFFTGEEKSSTQKVALIDLRHVWKRLHSKKLHWQIRLKKLLLTELKKQKNLLSKIEFSNSNKTLIYEGFILI